MFSEINNYKIIVRNINEKAMHYIPNVISMHPLDQLFTATEWLFKEALNDHNETHRLIKERRDAKGASQENIDAYDELAIRLGSRTQGYINQLCLMEDILIFEYRRMASLIRKGSKKKIMIDADKDFKNLKERFKAIRTFRNKVIAHTAYTSPKINRDTGENEDNPETVVRSILNLFPQSAYITVGDNFYSGFSLWRSELPVLTIFSWEEEIKPIFQDWKNLFIEKLTNIFDQLPIENKDFKIEAVNRYQFLKTLKRNT